jgi:hypothetical protein
MLEAAKDRERQLKGWSRAKKDALVVKLNPKWRDLISEWEEKYGLEFGPDDIVLKGSQNQPQDPSTPVSAPQEPTSGSWRTPHIPRWRKRAETLLRST